MAPDSPNPVRSFRSILRQFERVQKVQLEERDCCAGLTLAQCHPLLEIHDLGTTTAVELSSRLRLDKSTLSRTIDGLVRRGLVRRKTQRDDRRFVELSLTAEGRRLCDEINAKNDRYYQQVLNRVPTRKRPDLLASLKHLVRAMEEANAAGEPESDVHHAADAASCCSRNTPDTAK